MKVTSFEIGEFYTIRYPMKEWFDAFYESPAFNESPINDKGISMKGLTQVACVQVIGWNKKNECLACLVEARTKRVRIEC